MLGILMMAFRKALVLGIFASLFCIGRSEAAVTNLLVNGDFSQGSTGWGGIFEGAYVVDINDPNEADKQDWCPAPNGGYKRYLLFKGWYEPNTTTGILEPATLKYPGAGQYVSIKATNLATHGRFFTASFNAKFDLDYKADKTVLILKNAQWGYGDTNYWMMQKDFTEEINANRGRFHTYKAVYLRPTNLTLSGIGLIFQSYNFQCSETSPRTAIIDNIALSQQQASDVGPQLSVKIIGLEQTNGGTNNLVPPLVGKSSYYSLKIENQGGENLVVSSIGLNATGLSLSGANPITLSPGATQACTITANPLATGPITGNLEIKYKDKYLNNQTFTVKINTTAITSSDTFNDSAANLNSLGWQTTASSAISASSATLSNGALNLNVTIPGSTYPWSYRVEKTFASPGLVNLETSSLAGSLKASGVFEGLSNNKIQVRLESLNHSLYPTGTIQFGQWVDETTAGAIPGRFPPEGTYGVPDTINDRVVVLIPEDGNYHAIGGLLSSGVNTSFDPGAPYYRLIVEMTDFDFDSDANNILQVDDLSISFGIQPLDVSNGGFESGTFSEPSLNAQNYWSAYLPTGYIQYPADGVSKALMTNGATVYKNANLPSYTTNVVPFVTYAGQRSLKVYGQNFYTPTTSTNGGVIQTNWSWLGPSQTGSIYQEFNCANFPSLSENSIIHARAMAKIYSADPLTGSSIFNFGLKYMDAGNMEIGREVKTLTSTQSSLDQWVPLSVTGTIPLGTIKVQVISEFIQNAATDTGAVYLDDLSIGSGSISPSTTIANQTYSLVWSDEFDGVSLNAANWIPETGGGGWGNNEVQTYTDSANNLRVENGNLVLEAKKSGNSWTSARIKSQGLRSFKYGKIEFRAKLPTGIGPWPAAWMMGNNISSAGWPGCGEIDVMEWKGTTPTVVGHATHSPSRSGGNPIQTTATVSNPSTTFHTYAVLWEPGRVTFSVDGTDTGTWATPDSPVFEKEFFLLLNLAMGGSYVGNNIDSSLTSAQYYVDYVRVYQATLTSYQQYLSGLGISTSTAFNSDANGDGVKEGIKYAFNAASPQLGTSPATINRSGNTLTYTFDIRNDSTLSVVAQFSTNLTSWTDQPSSVITTGTGAATGYIRKIVTITTTEPRAFIRLQVTGN